VCEEGWPPVIDFNRLVHLWAQGYGTKMSTDPTIGAGLHAQAGRICHVTDYQYLITGKTFTYFQYINSIRRTTGRNMEHVRTTVLFVAVVPAVIFAVTSMVIRFANSSTRTFELLITTVVLNCNKTVFAQHHTPSF
jgi:hypothetical protein